MTNGWVMAFEFLEDRHVRRGRRPIVGGRIALQRRDEERGIEPGGTDDRAAEQQWRQQIAPDARDAVKRRGHHSTILRRQATDLDMRQSGFRHDTVGERHDLGG